ncbi:MULTISPECIES: hypothetical protein [Lelliottia]|uniref:hypothetical protein n=1 Tax=Lelliottia TaxID=1330545 RepID=UPI001304A73B|nr:MULTISPECIES: hypothetical protein [Lelliottia]
MKLRETQRKCQAVKREVMDYLAGQQRSVMDITISTKDEKQPFIIKSLIYKP